MKKLVRGMILGQLSACIDLDAFCIYLLAWLPIIHKKAHLNYVTSLIDLRSDLVLNTIEYTQFE